MNQILVEHVIVAGIHVAEDGNFRTVARNGLDFFEQVDNFGQIVIFASAAKQGVVKNVHRLSDQLIRHAFFFFIGTNLAADFTQHAPEHVREICLNGGLHGNIAKRYTADIHVHFLHTVAGSFHDAFHKLRIQPYVTGHVAVKAPAHGLGRVKKVFFDVVHIALRHQVHGQTLPGIGAQTAPNNFFS